MKTQMRYGVAFAAIVVVYAMIEHVLGFNTTRHDIGQYSRLAGVLVPIVGVYYGVRAQRDRGRPDRLTFGDGIKAGTVVAVIQTTLTTLWFWLYGSVINPSFLDTMSAFERQKLVAAGADASSIAEQVAQLQQFYSFPRLQLFQEAFGIAYGVLFAAVFTLILRMRWRPRAKRIQPLESAT